jgi:hypothetical protein
MQVHSHAELAHLLLADIKRTRQLYFELQRDSELRNLEEATNVRTAVEDMLHKHFVLCTCNDVVKEFIQSREYSIFSKTDDDDADVIALVCRTNDAPSDRPFKFSRVRVIRKKNERLLCSCACTTVHARPCRHLIRFNRGVLERSDFADCHTKKYHAHPHPPSNYIGVGDYNQDDMSQLPPLPPQMVCDAPHDADNADHADNNDMEGAAPAKKRKVKGYHSCAEEFKRVLVKWGNVSRVLQRFEALVREFDESLGAVETHRAGRPSSKPTPQASRR